MCPVQVPVQHEASEIVFRVLCGRNEQTYSEPIHPPLTACRRQLDNISLSVASVTVKCGRIVHRSAARQSGSNMSINTAVKENVFSISPVAQLALILGGWGGIVWCIYLLCEGLLLTLWRNHFPQDKHKLQTCGCCVPVQTKTYDHRVYHLQSGAVVI